MPTLLASARAPQRTTHLLSAQALPSRVQAHPPQSDTDSSGRHQDNPMAHLPQLDNGFDNGREQLQMREEGRGRRDNGGRACRSASIA